MILSKTNLWTSTPIVYSTSQQGFEVKYKVLLIII